MSAEAFRKEVRQWLARNFTADVRDAGLDSELSNGWIKLLGQQGWLCPDWPVEYGGAGLSFEDHIALMEEFTSQGIYTGKERAGQGRNMIGPTLLEYGTEEQKAKHLPPIARGEIQWCQGYSEPGSGSDLASLSTKAVRDGDHYVINGQKIWTSGAHLAQWIYVLVRTDPEASKHDGITLVLVDMDQPGVTVKPIKLISGVSPFSETFFDDAIADSVVGEINRGWTVGKRLLQHERAGISGMGAAGASASLEGPYHLAELAKQYCGECESRISDPAMRDWIIRQQQNEHSLELTLSRSRAENDTGETLSYATSIFKAVRAATVKANADLAVQIRGSSGTGWEGDSFTPADIAATRHWLRSRASSIAGGTNEVQLNIIAKRVLGLPD